MLPEPWCTGWINNSQNSLRLKLCFWSFYLRLSRIKQSQVIAMAIDMQYSLCTLVEFVFMPCYVIIVIIFQQCSTIDWVVPWHRQLNWVVRTALLEAPLKSVRGVNWKRILGSRPQSTENPILNGALFLLLTKSGPHLMREVISHRRTHQDHCDFIVYICQTHTFSTPR